MSAELIIVYGRRGVGKSALLRDVLDAAGFPFLYYRAVRRTLPLQLAALADAFRAAFPSVFLPQPFASTSVFLEALVYEAEAREQRGDKLRPNLKLFLCGSHLSFMERQVLDERAPLYNRRTGAMRLEPLDYAEWGAKDVEIGGVAVDEQNAVTAAGSCKWTNDMVGLREYDALRRDLTKSALAQADPFHVLFSRTGFNAPLVEFARADPAGRLILVSLNEMYAV